MTAFVKVAKYSVEFDKSIKLDTMCDDRVLKFLEHSLDEFNEQRLCKNFSELNLKLSGEVEENINE